MINAVSKELSNMKSCLRLLTSVLMLMTTATASAADLTVRIFERGGRAPLQGVAVCLGTSARLTQFGVNLTNAEGYVVFPEVPRIPLIVTASRPGYMGAQERMTGSQENRMLVLSMPTGGGGIQCTMEQNRVVQRTAGLDIESFYLNQGVANTANTQVTLDNKISGYANQYRASERSDFHSAKWLPYAQRPRFKLSAGQGKKTVYFQVRRYVRINDADIEARSTVMSDSIHVRF